MVMNRRRFLKAVGVGVAAGMARAGALSAAAGKAADRPNIVFVLADDLGYGDLQCLNGKSRIPTPNFDKLAASGMTFTDAHSGSAVCTPTRYGVVTGRYSWRTRLKRGVLNGYSGHLIDPERLTVAGLLKQAGYATGVVGKWHLGVDYARKGDGKTLDFSKPVGFTPNRYGFEYSYIVPASLDFPPYVYVENDRVVEAGTARQEAQGFPAYLRSGERGPNFRHVETLDVLLGKATGFIADKAKAARSTGSGQASPFFLYFALTAPHKPVLPHKRFVGKTKLGPYGDFITQVDWTVGQVVKALEDADVRENTLLIVTSDNGSFMHRLAKAEPDHVADATVQGYRASSHTSAGVFRGTKADIWEGGHHVPYLASWPTKVKAGSTCGETICLTDFMATASAVAGAKLPDNAGEDSFSTLPLLLGKPWAKPRAPVVHHSANGTFAVREGKWKLVLSSGSGGREKPAGKPFGKPYRLFDMAADISERTDLASSHPDVVEHLTQALKTMQANGRSR